MMATNFFIYLTSTLHLFDLVKCENTFTFLTGRIVQDASNTDELTDTPITALSPRHCAIYCHSTPSCLAANYKFELKQCRLFRDWNGTTSTMENDYSIIKSEFGVGRYFT